MNQYQNQELRAFREPTGRRTVQIHFRYNNGGQDMQAYDIASTPLSEGSAGAPFIELSEVQAQDLMEDLWAAGIRPTEGSSSADSLAATERHLKDMQDITHKLLEKVLAK